ncbi:LysR family transcriptional regulator [Pleomorphomonas diazotrophica]|uniref:LysR family transcriptional regulator n=1 Tax=Pleomorphomonas diazotrophica TaxID=1166257 RepID=A0A1I4V9Y5_9HYPH|nr:LysR family transcriptional regulator [Pleomorphomonas diazotrophica]PKR87336.1 LysR family transcriptional regulator [Pleomorphomonas diazotrophica]SFM97820.1 DNA-binding transcriptional regulator, LysR family [Pleomorphomonas diazotrophica]
MVDWENLRFLSVLAREGSFSASARQLGVEHATVSRRLAALEAECGLRLIDRRGRKVTLTAAGQRMAEVALSMDEAAIGVARLVASAQVGLSGKVILSAPPALAMVRLIGPLARLREKHPGLMIQLVGESREASLDRREADVAVRLSRPEKGDLTIRRIGQIAFRFCASERYLAATPPERWQFIAYEGGSMENAPQSIRLRAFAAGRPVGFCANSAELQMAAAVAGAGVAILPDFLAETAPRLVAIDDGEAPLQRDVWLVTHRDLSHTPAVRAVVEALTAAI